jgi:sRNA-binding regulator protein Hfq
VAGKISKIKAPDHTYAEARYFDHLIEDKVPLRVRLADNQEVDGTMEFYDSRFIRLTRKDAPNLFLFKHEIKYLHELPEKAGPETD